MSTDNLEKIREAQKSDKVFSMINNIIAPIIQDGIGGVTLYYTKKIKEKNKSD